MTNGCLTGGIPEYEREDEMADGLLRRGTTPPVRRLEIRAGLTH
jgi:hypothetical protein